MKLALRIAAAGLALLTLAVLALLVLLPPLARSEAVQARLMQAAQQATGRALRWSALEVGVLPPRLELHGPRVGDENATAPLSADAIALEVALWPLLSGRLEVDTIRIRQARATLVRTPTGIVHGLSDGDATAPGPADVDAAVPPTATGAAPTDAGAAPTDGAEEEIRFALRRLVIEDSAVELVDETLQPPATFRLRDVRGRATGDLARGELELALDAALEGGGPLTVSGSRSADGRAEGYLETSGLALAAFQPYLVESGARVAGTAVGRAELRRDGGDTLSAALRIEDAHLAQGGTALEGVVDLRLAPLSLASPLRAALELSLRSGSVRGEGFALQAPLRATLTELALQAPLRGVLSLDASEARMRADERFAKEPGVVAQLEGPFEQTPDGFVLGPAHLALGATRLGFSARSAERLELRTEPARIALAELAPHLPDLAEAGLSGELALGALVVRTAPLRVEGTLTAEPVNVAREGLPALVVRGELRGQGDGLHAPDLVLEVAGQPFHADVRIQGLGATPSHRVGLRARQVDSRALLDAFDPGHDTLSGPLDLDGFVAGPLGGDPLAELTGSLRFTVAPGRLRNVSLLKLAFDDLRAGAAAAVVAGRGGDLGRYEEDRFERLGGSIALAEGRAHSDDLQLVYRHYTVDLRGTVGLTDQALDLTGELTIDPEIDAVLSGDPEPERKRGRRRVFPLAHVGGTLDAPRIDLGDAAVLRFASAYIRDERRRRKWEGEIDERLGEGSGKAVLDLLDEVLQGGSP